MLNWSLQWLDHNSQRAYPFTDWATRTDQSGQITIPDSFLLGLYFPVSSALDVHTERFFLYRLGIFPTSYSLTLGYQDGTTPIPAAVGYISKPDHREFQSYALTGVGMFDESVGKYVVGKLTDLESLPFGLYTFDYPATCLEVDAIWPQIRTVSSITVIDGNNATPKIYGDILLTAGENVRLTYGSGPNGRSIRIDAIGGENLNEYCECELEPVGPPIRFINGVPPDQDGNLKIQGNPCIRLEATEGGLRIVETCATPCCGCNELEALVEQIRTVYDGAATLRHFVVSVEMAVSQMMNAVLSSRMSDATCIQYEA